MPAYNEAERLDVAALERYLGSSDDVRFLFVNDGSTDETGSLLRSICERWPARVSLLDLGNNRGKAEAVRAGIRHCTEDERLSYVGFWDADWATPLEAIGTFSGCLQQHPNVEIVLGARVALLGRNIERKAHRHYLGRVAATFASLVLGIPVYDTQCGAKLIRVSANTKLLFANRFDSGWVFDVELIARYLQATKSVAGLYELPLDHWTDVGESKVRPMDFLRAFGQMARIYRHYRLPRRYHRLVDFLAAQFSRYVAAGSLGTGMHYLTLGLVVEALGGQPWLGSALGATVGALVNYVLNYHFIFASTGSHRSTLFKFLVVAAIGIAISSSVVKFGQEQLHLNYWFAQIAATGLVLVVGFLLNKLWTFKNDAA